MLLEHCILSEVGKTDRASAQPLYQLIVWIRITHTSILHIHLYIYIYIKWQFRWIKADINTTSGWAVVGSTDHGWHPWLASIAHSPWLGRGLLEGAKETLLKYAAGLRMPRPAERGISTRRDAINISLIGRGI